MTTVPTLPSSTPSAFLALPLEIRQHIYRFCIPQNLCFICSGDIYFQNRPKSTEPWDDVDETQNTYETSEGHIPLDPIEDDDIHDSPHDDSPHDDSLHDDNEDPWTDFVDVDQEDEYKPSRDSELDDYSLKSQRHRPRISYSPSHRSALPGILLICRQINEEVEVMLYGGNTFRVDVHHAGQSDLERLFSPERREKMRKMILILRPRGVLFRPHFRMDPKIWDGLLGGLSILGLITQQPDNFEKWTAWSTSILENLRRALPKAAEVVVDANEEEPTVQMVERVMPGRCRFQRLRAGDFIFRRGEFSLESGYWDDDYWVDDGPTSATEIVKDCDYEYH